MDRPIDAKTALRRAEQVFGLLELLRARGQRWTANDRIWLCIGLRDVGRTLAAIARRVDPQLTCAVHLPPAPGHPSL